MNKCVIVGRISSEIELRRTQSGVETCTFSVAVNNGKDKNGEERPADFINCRAWRETANFLAKWFQKGKMIIIEGKFKTDKWQNKTHPDVMMYSSYILVDNVEFAGDKGGQTSAPAPAQQAAPQQTAQAEDYSDLSDFEEILSDGTDTPF